MIRDACCARAEGNVALRIHESASKDAFEVAGRGELQLAILNRSRCAAKVMRCRSAGRGVVYQNDPLTGPASGADRGRSSSMSTRNSPATVVSKLSERKADLVEMRPIRRRAKLRLTFHAPSRGLIGYYGEFLTDTRGTGVMNRPVPCLFAL